MLKSCRKIIGNIQFLASLYFLFFVLHFIFLYFYHNFFSTEPHFYEFNLLSLQLGLASILLLSLWARATHLKTFLNSWNSQDSRNTMLFIAVFFSSYLYSTYCSTKFALWGDEAYQLRYAAINPIQASSDQHQMPLSYYLSYATDVIFGPSLSYVRLHAKIFYSLGMGLLFLFVRYCTKSLLFPVIAVLISYTHLTMANYSFEARPQSVALFFLIGFLLDIITAYKIPRLSSKTLLILLTSSCLFLLSIGFQPPFFVFFTLLSFALINIHSTKIKNHLLIALTLFSSAIFWAFFQFIVVNDSPKRLFNMNFEHIFYKDFLNFKFFNFSNFLLFTPEFPTFKFLISLIILLIYGVFFQKSLSKRTNLQAKRSLALLLGTTLFTLLSYNFFKQHVDWPFFVRYIYVAIPTTIISLVIFMNWLYYFLKFRENRVKKIVFTIILIISLSASLNKSTLSNYFIYSKTKHRKSFDSKSSYDFIKTNIPAKSPVICYNDSLSNSCSGVVHAIKYMMAKHDPLAYRIINIPIIGDEYKLSEFKSANNFALVLEVSTHQIEGILEEFNFKNHIFVGLGFVGEIEIKNDFLAESKDILRRLQLFLAKRNVQGADILKEHLQKGSLE